MWVGGYLPGICWVCSLWTAILGKIRSIRSSGLTSVSSGEGCFPWRRLSPMETVISQGDGCLPRRWLSLTENYCHGKYHSQKILLFIKDITLVYYTLLISMPISFCPSSVSKPSAYQCYICPYSYSPGQELKLEYQTSKPAQQDLTAMDYYI
jgi:hypothetical protein